jgi:hypothetical protein
MTPIDRPTRRHWAATLLMTLAIPPALLGCDQSKALLPLMDACNGNAIAEAAAYDAKTTEKPIIAGFVFGRDLQQLDQRYVSTRFPQASTVQETQLVLCVNLQPRKSLEDCSYTGTVNGTATRTERSAEVKLVAAKTGEIVQQETLTAQVEACPDFVTDLPSESSWNIHQETTVHNPFNADFLLRDRVGEWSFQVMTPASPTTP